MHADSRNRNDPIIKQILGQQWDGLADIIKEHYALRPFSSDHIVVKGEMDEIYHSHFAKILIPFGWLLGAIVPFNRNNVPTEVHYNSRPENSNIYWHRMFQFKSRKVFHFKSHMEQQGPKQVIEFVRFGVGMKLAITVEEGNLIFRSIGFVWRVFGIKIPVPLKLLFGDAYIVERAIDAKTFAMKMCIKHRLFGELFRYSGQFRL